MRTLAWPMEPPEVGEVARALRFGHFQWDVYMRGRPSFLPDAMVLTDAEHAELVEAAETTWRALRELERAVLGDPEVLAAIGVPEELHPALAGERQGSPRVSRCDFHRTIAGEWVMSELNEDGPGGFVESAGLQAVLGGHFADRFDGLRFVGDLEAAVTGALSPFERVGLVYPTAYSEALQHVALVSSWLMKRGHQTVLGSPANLVMKKDQAMLFEQPIDAVFRYFPGEWMAKLPNVADWERAVAAVPMMNSLAALAAQSKRFYAAAAEHELQCSMTAAEEVAAYLPVSIYLHESRRERLLAERERWVLKGAFGRMGDTVRLGLGTSAPEWELALDRALEDPVRFVVQERFDTAPMWFSGGLGYATVGAFLVDGRFAGYYSRVSRNPVVNYESSHVATLVEVS